MAELGNTVETTIEPRETQPSEWVHPLDYPRVRSFLKENLGPDLMNDLVNSTRPRLSDNPDQLELNEANTTKERRLPVDYEETGSWVARTLYEETFGVTPVATLGGILTHHFREIHNNGQHISPNSLVNQLTAIEKTILTLPAEQALDKVRAIDLIEAIGNLGVPANDPYGSFRLEGSLYDRVAENPVSILRSPQNGPVFQRGWLLLRCLYAFIKELATPCTDKRVIEEFKSAVNKNFGSSRIEILVSAWQNLGRPEGNVLTESGTFKRSGDAGFQDGLKSLAILRASPDFGFLYKQFSAQGSLNQPK